MAADGGGDAAPRPGTSSGAAVDVVLPVYGPSPDLGRCLASLRACTDLGRHRLVVVADGPLPEGPARLLSELEAAAPGGVLVLRSPVRRGYVASANAGMRASERDVVLLNSDTEVAEGWLESLAAAARSAPDVASATPFSGNATLCSLPFAFAENRLPAGHSVRSFARVVSERSARTRPRIPTGVGFCLYLRREALADAGLFDEEAFGVGYGEEVDLCLRLAARGWSHVLDDAAYVWHRGAGSFGGESAERARRAERLLARRHPGFLPRVAAFMREDPLRPARERVLEALRPRRSASAAPLPRVLHLAGGWPGGEGRGAEGGARPLALGQARRGDVAAWAAGEGAGLGDDAGRELFDSGVRVRFVGDGAGLARFLDEVRPEVVHVHEPGGAFEAGLRLLRRRGTPVLVQLHAGRPERRDGAGAVRRGLEALRARVAPNARRYAASSEAVLASWADAGLLPGATPVEVLPPGAEAAARRVEAIYAELLAAGGVA
jgi:GT2 family glycosyltransferase